MRVNFVIRRIRPIRHRHLCGDYEGKSTAWAFHCFGLHHWFAGEVLAGGTLLLPALLIIACAFGFGCLLLLISSLHRSGILTPLGPVEALQVKRFARFLLSASFIAGVASEYNTSWSLHVVETPLTGPGAKLGETVLIDMLTKRQRVVAVTALERGDQNPIHAGRYGVFWKTRNLF